MKKNWANVPEREKWNPWSGRGQNIFSNSMDLMDTHLELDFSWNFATERKQWMDESSGPDDYEEYLKKKEDLRCKEYCGKESSTNLITTTNRRKA